MTAEIFDLLVIGGGINGVGIARDAAGRGLSVALCEQGDLAGATSSASSKLIHGGLRYLEHYKFRLVREALTEREVLLRMAPHIARPMRFVLPHVPELRPAWMIRAGLLLYDWLAGSITLPRSGAVALRDGPFGVGLDKALDRGFVYSDCWVDDARLVVLNARSAADLGACVYTRTRFEAAEPAGDTWRIRLRAGAHGVADEIRARVIVNAAGPWVDEALAATAAPVRRRRIRQVKGSHIVVPRVYPGDHACILQNHDRRVVFIIPYENDYSCIGTTEITVAATGWDEHISEEETAYLCSAVNRYLEHPVQPRDVVWSYAGVRPLYDDGVADPSKVTRDYLLELSTGGSAPALLTVYGGKLTTYRRLAEEALHKLASRFPGMRPPWTHEQPLPGGDLPGGSLATYTTSLRRRFEYLPPAFLTALARRHGTRCGEILHGVASEADLGRNLGAGLYAREIDYLRTHEWAVTGEDVLWRRTKCGLHMDDAQRRGVVDYLAGGTPT